GEAPVGYLELDRHRCALGEPLQRRSQAVVGEQDGMEPACELPQLTQGVVELRGRLCQQLVRLLGCGPELRAGDAQRQRERHQALLCAVVEVSLELPPLLVACAYQPSP